MTAYAIQRPDTAFTSSRQRKPRKKDAEHLVFVRTLPCVICGARGCHAAHIRYSDAAFQKRETGMAEKPDDKFVLPLCPRHHTEGDDAQHKSNEREWWVKTGINPVPLAVLLYAWTGDEETCERVIAKARMEMRDA